MARTALFSWAFARHHGGRFVFRIEDTDAARDSEESYDLLVDVMRWLGLDWDEGVEVGGPNGPYRQSERMDIYADVARRYPERFAAFGCVPLPHVDAALGEVERCLDTLGMVGITTGCSIEGRPLDDPAFEPFWAALDRRGAALFLHPMGVGFGGELKPYGLDWLVGALFEPAAALGKHVMIAGIDASNEGSIRMHERLSFQRGAVLHEVGRKFGRWLDLLFMEKILDAPGAPR